MLSSGTTDQSIAKVTVPPLGQSGVLSVIVTNANGDHLSASVIVKGADPAVAGRTIVFCNFWHDVMYRFRPPIWVDPGDPYKYRHTQSETFSQEQLKTMNETILHLQTNLKAVEQNK